MIGFAPVAALGLGALVLWWLASGDEQPPPIGPTPEHELEALALGAYRQPWPTNSSPSVLQLAIEAYQRAGIEPAGLLRFFDEWQRAGDLVRSQYGGVAIASGNPQIMIDVAASLSQAGWQELAAGLLLVARFYVEGPTPNLVATADWMARGADPAKVPTA